MLTLKPSTPDTHRFPWEDSRACREYRAMGLELELIEVVHRRELTEAQGEPVEVLDRQIAEISDALADEATAAATTP